MDKTYDNMNIHIHFEELCDLMSEYTKIGFMSAIKAYEPSQDIVRKAELKRWLKMMLVDEKKINYLIKSGQIKEHRMGNGTNSPIYYSKEEIMSAMTSAKVFNITTKSALQQDLDFLADKKYT